MQRRGALTLEDFERKQSEALRLGGKSLVKTPREAERFLKDVGIALRYHPGKGLPLASLYRAAAGPEPGKAALVGAIALTNHLLARALGIEVQVIADRVSLVDRSLVPALYALVRRGRPLEDLEGLGVHARTAATLLRESREVTAGEVRKQLGLPFAARKDPAYAALGELQRHLLVDRGPFQIPKAGIPYLSSEGYPYHFFHEAHAELAQAASRYSTDAAAEDFLHAYVDAAVFARPRKLASLFKAFLAKDEIDAALERLVARKRLLIRQLGRETIALSTRLAC